MRSNLKILFFSLLFMEALFIKAQNIKIGYTYTFSSIDENFNATIYLGDQNSLFEIDELNPIDKATGEYDDNGKYNIVVKSKKYLNRKIIKNFKNDTLLYYNPEKKNKKKYIIVKEPLEFFNWQLVNSGDEKTILNRICKKATTSFRGKDYEVWYASDLKFTDGPWKFWGLPGLILEVKSTDNTFSITATSLQINDNSELVINTTVPKTAISWEEYKKVVEKQLINQKKFLETSFLTTVGGASSISATYRHDEPDLEVILK